MTTLQLRKKVHEYVDRVDDDTLEMMLAMLKVKVEAEAEEKNSLLSKTQQKEVLRRYERHVVGEGTVYTLEEAKQELQLRSKNRKTTLLMSESQLKVSQDRLKLYKAGKLKTVTIEEAERKLYARKK